MDKKMVGNICMECSFSCFKAGCPRGDWNKTSYPADRKYGKDEKCPVLQFEAEKPEKKRSVLGRSPVTVQVLNEMCSSCQFSETKGDTVSLEKCFEAHCMDCICNQMREGILEMEAEARCNF